ncbi:MAG: HAD family hydrolase [Thermoplasmata archaeon]|nr:HAD family hydrolase [Thermoplasmata archaeon]
MGTGPRNHHRRAVFVDRDGTINPDLKYLADAARLEVFKGVSDGIRLLREHGYLIICVTNQSGIERGFYTEPDVHRIHARVNEILAHRGAKVDAFYFCPHAPETGCDCRKPGVELFLRAQREWGISFGGSAFIGDRALDVEAGERLGLLTAVVPPPGQGPALEEELRLRHVTPDIRAHSFWGAAMRILSIG